MQKEATWLLGELKKLVSDGVLDEAAAERLRMHYAPAVAAQGPGWGMILLAIGGAALVGLGVILIFAHNWENWTPGVRVALSFAPLLLGQSAAFYALKNGGRLWSEGAGLFTAIAIGASTALIAQTYQFGGDLPQFLLVWTLLALPLIYLLDSSAVAALCWLGVLGWAFASNDWHWSESADAALFLPMFLLLAYLPLPHLLRHIRRDRLSARVAWLLRVALVVLVLGLAIATQHQRFGQLWSIYASLAAVAALTGRLYFADARGLWGNPLEGAGLLGVYVVALLATFDEAWRHVQQLVPTYGVLPAVFGLAALALAWKSIQRGDRFLAPVLAALTPLFFLFNALAFSQTTWVISFAHLYVFVLGAALIRSGLQQARLGFANQGVALIAALVLLRFFDSDLSYIVRGVGFIATGVGFFVAILWLRRRVTVSA